MEAEERLLVEAAQKDPTLFAELYEFILNRFMPILRGGWEAAKSPKT